jgi:nucleoside-diphosphate-sugar epimerase
MKPHINTILITGATGFLGKVLAEELLRRRNDYNITKVVLLIRSTETMDAYKRFEELIAASLCFKNLPQDWVEHVRVINGDLAHERCGIQNIDYADICQNVTHIVHAAGCTKFDSTISEALSSNIDGALHMLEIARDCYKLQHFVTTSTAYVTPPHAMPIYESLVHLPRPSIEIYNDLKNGNLTKKEALELTGHPNIYSLSKCLAENLISERRGSLPVTIVRPSIICAAWKHPMPGWIDSKAAFAGFVLCFGKGILKVVNGRLDTKLDIIPVDEVASHLIREIFHGYSSVAETIQMRIVFSVATVQHSLALGDTCQKLQLFFKKRNDTSPRPKFRYIGPRTLVFMLSEFFNQRMRLHMHATICRVQGKRAEAIAAKKAYRLVTAMNVLFEPYTNQTYDFRPASSTISLNQEEYTRIICTGVCENLM